MLFETIYGKNKNGTDVRQSKLVIWQLRETKFSNLDNIPDDLRRKHAQISLLLLYWKGGGFIWHQVWVSQLQAESNQRKAQTGGRFGFVFFSQLLYLFIHVSFTLMTVQNSSDLAEGCNHNLTDTHWSKGEYYELENKSSFLHCRLITVCVFVVNTCFSGT